MTNTNTKMTKKDYFNKLLTIDAVTADADLTEFINHELELLNRPRRSTSSADQVKNDNWKADIISTLNASNAPMSIKAMQNANKNLAELTNQRISSLLKGLCDSGVVTRGKDKRISVFSLA